jgi:predicted regulator of Ras-like GTPase activity (Roadblock/LC7/MglB family)
MSTLQIFWVGSALAAVLFFIGGYWTAKWLAMLQVATPVAVPIVPHKFIRLRASASRDYDGIVSRFAERGDVRCVSLADIQGLPIAGRGENQDGLAALSGVLLESAARAGKLVPMGTVMRIHVESEAGTTINAYPVAVGGNEVVLATLTEGPGPDEGELRRVLEGERGTA